MHGIKTVFSKTALLATALLTCGALGVLAPPARAQISVNIGVQPVCSYGYYDYAPYACAPVGFYGPGYFYGGVFLGMGPWAGWGYSHGWGSHRFVSEGGGRYHGGGGAAANRAYASHGREGGGREVHAAPARSSGGHAVAAHHNTGHPSGAVHQAPHAAAHSGAAHGGGEAHGGGGRPSGGGRPRSEEHK
jgi:hypothetical protein